MDRIVVGIDRSDSSAAGLRWAAAEARMSFATLDVVHAYPAPLAHVGREEVIERIDPGLHGAMVDKLAGLITDAEADLDGVEVHHRLHPGRASDGLLQAARDADLLVVGSRGAGGFEGLLLGSTAASCVRTSVCPVVVVPATPLPGTGRISVGVDGSPAAERALAWAVDEAHRRGADLEVVGVYHPYDEPGPYGGVFMQLADPGSTERFRREAEEHVDKALASLQAAVPVRRKVLAGPPAKVLLQRTADTDLLVLGRHDGHGRGASFLGSVTRQVLHHAASPVAIVPGLAPAHATFDREAVSRRDR
jgi:nucleotide-binding universal stress UspA family protein